MKTFPVSLVRNMFMFCPNSVTAFLSSAKALQKVTEAYLDIFPPWNMIKSSIRSDIQSLAPKISEAPDFANTTKKPMQRRRKGK